MQDYDSKLFTEEQIERALEENNIRAYFLEVDFKDLSREYNTSFQFAKGEVNSGFICFKLLYGERGIILKRGCTVYANIRKTTGETFKSNLSVLDYQNGIVLLSLSSQVLSIVGVDKLELAVVIDEEKTISPKIKYKVYESFDGDDKADAENHPPLLDSEDLRLLITELRKEVEVNKVNIEDLTEKTGSNLKLIQSNTTKINSNTSEIEKIKQYNTNNDSKISNIENSIEENTNNISTNTNKIGELENKANTNESNVSSNTSKIELIKGEIETLKQYDSNNDTKISEIESKIDTNKSGIANNSSKIEQAMSKIEENKVNISGNSSKIRVLENKIPTIESKVSGHASKIEAIEGKIPTVESGILDSASKIDKLEKKIPTIETNISGNSSNISKIETKVGSLETTVSGNSSSIEEVKGEVATIKSGISSNTSEVSKLKEKLSGIEPKVTSVVSKVGEIERQIPAIESKISGNTSNISTVKTKVEKNTSDIAKISKRLDGLVVNPNVDLEEIVQARTATTGEIFDTLDERIDHEVDRLNKKIEVSFLQQEDKESHTIENSVDGMTTDMVVRGRTLQNLFETYSTEELSTKIVCRNKLRYFQQTGTTYTLVNNTNLFIEYQLTYKESDAYINTLGVEANSIRVYTLKENESITRCEGLKKVGWTIDDLEKLKKSCLILEGDWTNKPIPQYFEGIKSFGQQEDKISILSHNKNLFDYSKLTGGEIVSFNNKKCFKFTDNSTNFTFNVNGKVNKQYTISIKMYREPSQVEKKLNIKFIYSDGTVKFYNLDSGNLVSYTSEVGKTLSKINGAFNHSLNCYIDLECTQLEEGTKSTSFEPYQFDKKDILLPFSDGLKSVGNVCDELVSNTKKAIERIQKDVFVGNEDWTIRDDIRLADVTVFRLNSATRNQYKTDGFLICNKFNRYTNQYQNYEGIRLVGSEGYGVTIGISKSKLTTDDSMGFKNLLKKWNSEGNPLILYSEMTTPVEHDLPSDLEVNTYQDKTYVEFQNSISGTSSFKAPVDSATTIARLNRENRALEEENKNLRQDFESTTLSLTDSDLELVKQNVDMDFRLMEVEFALDIPQSTLSSNINFKKKGEVKSMARTPYEMMKIVILSGDYDREDYIHKVGKYYERGRMTKEEYDELMSLMTADEVISKKI